MERIKRRPKLKADPMFQYDYSLKKNVDKNGCVQIKRCHSGINEEENVNNNNDLDNSIKFEDVEEWYNSRKDDIKKSTHDSTTHKNRINGNLRKNNRSNTNILNSKNKLRRSSINNKLNGVLNSNTNSNASNSKIENVNCKNKKSKIHNKKGNDKKKDKITSKSKLYQNKINNITKPPVKSTKQKIKKIAKSGALLNKKKNMSLKIISTSDKNCQEKKKNCTLKDKKSCENSSEVNVLCQSIENIVKEYKDVTSNVTQSEIGNRLTDDEMEKLRANSNEALESAPETLLYDLRDDDMILVVKFYTKRYQLWLNVLTDYYSTCDNRAEFKDYMAFLRLREGGYQFNVRQKIVASKLNSDVIKDNSTNKTNDDSDSSNNKHAEDTNLKSTKNEVIKPGRPAFIINMWDKHHNIVVQGQQINTWIKFFLPLHSLEVDRLAALSGSPEKLISATNFPSSPVQPKTKTSKRKRSISPVRIGSKRKKSKKRILLKKESEPKEVSLKKYLKSSKNSISEKKLLDSSAFTKSNRSESSKTLESSKPTAAKKPERKKRGRPPSKRNSDSLNKSVNSLKSYMKTEVGKNEDSASQLLTGAPQSVASLQHSQMKFGPDSPQEAQTAPDVPVKLEKSSPSCGSQKGLGILGVHNLGNTCYLGSVLQVLRYTPHFTENLRQISNEIKATEKEKLLIAELNQLDEEDYEEALSWNLTRALNHLYERMERMEERFKRGLSFSPALRPYDIMHTIEQLNPMFEGNLQHDAHELLCCIMAYLKDGVQELNSFRRAALSELINVPAANDSEIDCGKLATLELEDQPMSTNKNKDAAKIYHTCENQIIPDASKNTSESEAVVTSNLDTGSLVLDNKPELLSSSDVRKDLGSFDGKAEQIDINKNVRSRAQFLSSCDQFKADTPCHDQSRAPCCVSPSSDNQSVVNENSEKPQCESSLNTVASDESIQKNCENKMLSCFVNVSNCLPPGPVGTRDSNTPPDCTDKPHSNSENIINPNQTLITNKTPALQDNTINCNPAQKNCTVPLKRSKLTARKTLGVRRKSSSKDAVPTALTTLASGDDESARKVVYEYAKRARISLHSCDLSKHFPESHYYHKQMEKLQKANDIRKHCSDVDDHIDSMFKGSMVLRTRCLVCETCTERRENYSDVNVAVKKERPRIVYSTSANLSDTEEEEQEYRNPTDPSRWLRESFCEVERLVKDNKYSCDECAHLAEAERSVHYLSFPDILTIHIKRFASCSGLYGGLTKINDYRTTPFVLPCMRDQCSSTCSEHVYYLYGIIVHTGITLSSGHYVAYVRAPADRTHVKHPKTVTAKLSLTAHKNRLSLSHLSQRSANSNHTTPTTVSQNASSTDSSYNITSNHVPVSSTTVTNESSNSVPVISNDIQSSHAIVSTSSSISNNTEIPLAQTISSHDQNNKNSNVSNDNKQTNSLCSVGSHIDTSHSELVLNKPTSSTNDSRQSNPSLSTNNSGSPRPLTPSQNCSNSNGASKDCDYSQQHHSQVPDCSGYHPFWYQCDDDNVKLLSHKEMSHILSPTGSGNPYLLFYSKYRC